MLTFTSTLFKKCFSLKNTKYKFTVHDFFCWNFGQTSLIDVESVNGATSYVFVSYFLQPPFNSILVDYCTCCNK
jgi:hypothetical protein